MDSHLHKHRLAIRKLFKMYRRLTYIREFIDVYIESEVSSLYRACRVYTKLKKRFIARIIIYRLAEKKKAVISKDLSNVYDHLTSVTILRSRIFND